MPDLIPLFVYGILKVKGGEVAWVRGDIYDLGGCPGARRMNDDEAGWIKGQIRYVTDQGLAVMDRIESVPTMYQRVQVRVYEARGADESSLEAWAYEFGHQLSDDMRCGEEWGEDGYDA